MKVHPDYYARMSAWIAEQATLLAHHDPLKLPEFIADVAPLGEALLALVQSVPSAGGWGAALAWGQWALAHPDPLKPLRQAFEAMQAKWTVHV